ncbi:membrane-associated protein, putative [Bodo saltans]|uniref:Membrane-associated protein, putative n=1 Tax=Bodo saltans TaxID=75058 RepID=A0A0S4JLM3_BODSA|nr:membrane-associated protein, putative [Bodo saltans]|eukprot:CUG91528.1 membrane-associated protein, putative [Bodo saltans]
MSPLVFISSFLLYIFVCSNSKKRAEGLFLFITMKFLRSITVAFVVVIMLCLAAATVSSELVDDKYIRCKVCDRAIAHIWHQGVELRKHCKTHGTDPRCYITNLHKHGVEEMVRDVCEDLPKTHQSLTHSEFDLVVHDNPNHDAEIITAIRDSCVKWVHDTHTVEAVTRLIYANLDAGKSTQVILHRLQERFCDAACRPEDDDKREDL